MKLIGSSLIAFGVTIFILAIATYLAYMKPFPVPRHAPFPNLNYVMTSDEGWDGNFVREELVVCCCYWHEPDFLGRAFENADFRNARATVQAIGSRPDRQDLHPVALNDLLAFHVTPTLIEAIYPRQALARGQEGDVLVEATLAPDGTVTAATIVDHGPNGQFDKAALKAVMAARFDAPVRDGQQVRPITRRFLIRFRLPATA